MRFTRGSTPLSLRPEAKVRAARIGPTVWELDGPIPTLNISKTLIAMACRPPTRSAAGRIDREARAQGLGLLTHGGDHGRVVDVVEHVADPVREFLRLALLEAAARDRRRADTDAAGDERRL